MWGKGKYPYLTFFTKRMKENNISKSVKLVSSAILGLDIKVVIVAGKRYAIQPPTIERFAGAGMYLAEIADCESISDLLQGQSIEASVKALSWFVCGNDKLADELKQGTLTEITTALAEAYSLCGLQDFSMLSTLAKNVARMVANTKQ